MNHATSTGRHSGATIAAMRDALGWTLADLSEATRTNDRPRGYSVSYISDIERGATEGSSAAIAALETALAAGVIARHARMKPLTGRRAA